MEIAQESVRISNRRATRSLGLDRNRLIDVLSVSVVVAAAWAGNMKGEADSRLPTVSVSASADDGNVPSNTLDGSLVTRWSAAGDGQWVRYDLGSPTNIGSVKIAWYKGDQRKARFDIQTSATGTDWATVFSGQSSGTSAGLESYDVTGSPGKFIRVVGHGTSQDLWNSITEVEAYAPSVGVDPGGSNRLHLSIGRPSSGPMIVVNWNGPSGATSQMQVSSDLVSWSDVGAAITNTGAIHTWQEGTSSQPAYPWPVRFYRVKQISASPPGGTTSPTNTPNAGLPSGRLNLANWKLTLPIDTAHAGSPDEILQPELTGFQDANYFHCNLTGTGVVLQAFCGGATTSGSGYPRSELREMVNNGTGTASWSTTSGTHTMEITQAITHLPEVKPHVVAGQIHDANDDVIVFRLEGTKLFIDQNGVNGPVVTPNYRLGDLFTVKFVARNGGVGCYYNGQYIYTYNVSASGCYFKAGCYTQSNTSKGDAATAYGEVIIYGLSVTHQ
jgi:hypothetical protein